MRWTAVVMAMVGCGRIGFDASSSGDGGGAGDGASTDGSIDAAPFVPGQVSTFATYSAAGAVTKLATDGTSLFVTRSDLSAVTRYAVPSAQAMPFTFPLQFPGGLAYASGYLYISERGTGSIIRALTATGDLEPFVAGFDEPRGLATDGTYLYVADRGTSCTIARVEIATRDVATIAGVDGDCGMIDGSRTTARLLAPGGLVVVGATLYVTDTPAIRAVDLGTLEVTTIAGGVTTGFADLPGPAARFSTSISEIAERDGILYAADSYNHRIRTIDPVTRAVGTLAGDGTDQDTPGPLANAQLHEPDGLVFLGPSLYVASDRSIHRID